MSKKKYINNVESGARHHYDVYELVEDRANHIAPFTQEFEAYRVAEALAALDALDVGVEHEKKYVVRARPTVAHNIHRMDAKGVKRQYDSLAVARKNLARLLAETPPWNDEPTRTSVGEDEPKKKRSILKRKKSVAKS